MSSLKTKAVSWMVLFHDEFVPEFDSFSKDVQDELLATALILKQLGPEAGRPHVGTLSNEKHSNMKELRFKANHGAEIWRAAFAFDIKQQAIILVAADKQGVSEKRFYKDLLHKANERFDRHLDELRTNEDKSPKKQAPKNKPKGRPGKAGK